MIHNPENIAWHLGLSNEVIGPLEYSKVKELFISGKANGQTPVWHDKMSDWATAKAVPELSSLMIGAKPPPLVQSKVAGLADSSSKTDSAKNNNSPEYELTPERLQGMAEHAVELACQTKARLKLAPALRMGLLETMR